MDLRVFSIFYIVGSHFLGHPCSHGDLHHPEFLSKMGHQPSRRIMVSFYGVLSSSDHSSTLVIAQFPASFIIITVQYFQFKEF